MPLVTKEDFHKVLAQVERGETAPVYLLHGEDYLVKTALAELTDILIPKSQQSTNLQVVDGSQADFRAILDSVNTFSLFSGRKAVVVQDSLVFYSQTNLPALFNKSKEAYEAGDLEAAARLLLEVLSFAGWSLSDLAAGAWREIPKDIWQQTLGVDRDKEEMVWLESAVEHASGKEMAVPKRSDDASLLEAALQEDFPPENYLVLTTDTVDKRRSLYRHIKEKGVVLDFSVVSGSSRQARKQQEIILKNLAQEVLSEAGKTIDPSALALLLERTGFNLWALRSQLEKLIAFSGDEKLIAVEQVDGMSGDFREEPLYELNNAVAERDCGAALRLLNRLLDQDYHPLQLLGSLANEIRRLLAAREFVDEHLSGRMDAGISYGRFQKSIVPLIKEKAGKDSPLANLHPFALHKTIVRSSSCRTSDLITAMQDLFGTDVSLKSTSIPGRALMESLILRLCQTK